MTYLERIASRLPLTPGPSPAGPERGGEGGMMPGSPALGAAPDDGQPGAGGGGPTGGAARPPLLRQAGVEFALALQFLTTAPALVWREVSPREVGRSMAWFPLVGALVGLALGGLDALLGLAFDEPLRSGLTVVALLLLTRALHLDGLMDTCDGLFGGWTPERRLEIMRDSRVGSFGVLAAIADVLVRVLALAGLPPGLRLPALVLMATLGRWSLVYAARAFPYARPTGLGAAYKQHLGRGQVLAATATAVAVALAAALLPGWVEGTVAPAMALRAAGLALVAWLIAWLFGRYVVTRVPGQTGDTYGATNELVEVAVLLILSARVWGA